jgi:hypothetical protein
MSFSKIKSETPTKESTIIIDSEACSYCLLLNLEIVTNTEYWISQNQIGGNNSPAIRTSTNKQVLIEISKRLKNDRMDSIT